jgi:predicted ATPase/DNA-binding CsgD family transcriptional regulator
VVAHLAVRRSPVIGRSEETRELAEAVREHPGRLVTVTGCGGVGKTTLATEAARELLSSFPDGVWFVDLSSVGAPSTLAATIGRALGLRDGADVDQTESLLSFVRDRRLLLILDNCEHLIESVAVIVDDLLDASAELRVLATSREALRVTGERLQAANPLTVPESAVAVEKLAGFGSVKLFLDRARSVRPDLELTDENAGAVVEICRRLDGIPLALELAATRAHVLPLEAMAERLSQGFDLLIAKGRSRPERQQTMRAALEWSHALLSGSEQFVLRRLGVIAGPWTLDTAEGLCASPDLDAPVADLVASLVDKSMVVTVDVPGQAWFRLLAPVAEYAAGKLAASGESELIRTRLAEFFVARAEAAEPHLHQQDQLDWIRRLDLELPNLRLAVRTALDRADAAAVMRLCGGLWWYAWQRGHLREAVSWLEPVLDEPDIPAPARVVGLRAAAMWFGSLGDVEKLSGYAAAMLALSEELGDLAQQGVASMLLGMAALGRGDLPGSRRCFERALESGRATSHSMLVGHALVNLGQVAARDRSAAEAEALFEQAAEHFCEVSDRWGGAYAENFLAGLARGRGDHAAAVRRSTTAVGLLDELGDQSFLISVLSNLASTLAMSSRHAAATSLFAAAEVRRRSTGGWLSDVDREDLDAQLDRLKMSLGASEYERAWAVGREAEVAALINLVVQTAGPPTREAGRLEGPGGHLTAREIEVTRLLAAGFSNRQIAEQLVITSGTVGVHVEHILRKLDLRSRHQVADWATARGLGGEVAPGSTAPSR